MEFHPDTIENIWASLTKYGDEQFARPHPERNITRILPTALTFLDIQSGKPTLFDLDNFPNVGAKVDKVLVVFVDSLGLDQLFQSSTVLHNLYPGAGTWLTSVFPSITSSAITSVCFGVPPTVHGVTGHVIYLPQVGDVVDMLSLKVPGADAPSLPDCGINISDWTGSHSLLTPETCKDLPIHNVTPRSIVNSGLSQLVYGPAVQHHGYGQLVEGFTMVKLLLERRERNLVYFYYPGVDETSHKFGPGSQQAQFQLQYLDHGLSWLARQLDKPVRRRTLMVLISDHGQCAFDTRYTISISPERREYYSQCGVFALGFSGRVVHIYSQDREKTRAALVEDVADIGLILSAEEAADLAGGSEGIHPDFRERMGDLVIMLRPGGRFKLLKEPKNPSYAPASPYYDFYSSNHGSLTAGELLVPTIFATLQDLLDVERA